MELRQRVVVAAAPEAVVAALRDARLLAGSTPGATVTDRDGDTHRGRIALLVGGRDLDATGTAVLVPGDTGDVVTWTVSGAQTDGPGQVDGVFTARVAGHPRGSEVAVGLTGTATGWDEPAPGVALERAARAVLTQLARNLEAQLLAPRAPEAAAGRVPSDRDPAGETVAGTEVAGEPCPATQARPGSRTDPAGPAGALLSAVVAAGILGWIAWRRWGPAGR